jgi:two-component system LytT family response regulator
MKLRTLIADDEPLARDRLKALLSAEEEIELIGECRNGREVVEQLKTQAVDLLFLDIQMPGNTGFDVIDQIGLARMPLTVFVTAHHKYAVKAFEVHALDYLTKPVEPSRLGETLVHVRERINSKAAVLTQEKFQAVMASLGNPTLERSIPNACLSLTASRTPSSTSAISNGSKPRTTMHAFTWARGVLCCARP